MITINNIKLPLDSTEEDIKKAARSFLGASILELKILKKSVDARNKADVRFVYTVEVLVKNEEKVLKHCKNKNVAKSERKAYTPPTLAADKNADTVVVGSGPAGLFCAYVLAKAGADVTLIERGLPVEERTKSVELFKKTGILDTESNIQFGEGGAGTFSDGKLNTGIKDERIRFVLETFAKFANGEADDILINAKPHLGTDRLVSVVKNMRNEIKSLGASVLFSHKLDDIIVENGKLSGISLTTPDGKKLIPCKRLVLATGHSARDTFAMLKSHNVAMEQKPFAMGVRIEHPREMINKSQYGDFADHDALGTADYKISCTPNGKRGVYSFCMCPGGVVVPAASEEGMLAVNGMSEYKRMADNSNAALLVGVSPDDLRSSDPLAGIELQRKTEKAAWAIGGGYKAPVQLAGDLLNNKASTDIGDIKPSYEPGFVPCDLKECLPDFIIDSIRAALPIFSQMIEGYDRYDAVLTGVESRSSSPVRILRDPVTLCSSIEGLYPCGEGAGYAGGIVSAAVDGIKCAERIIAHISEIG